MPQSNFFSLISIIIIIIMIIVIAIIIIIKIHEGDYYCSTCKLPYCDEECRKAKKFFKDCFYNFLLKGSDRQDVAVDLRV